MGDTVQLGYVDQSRDDLDGNKTVWEEVSDGLDILRIGNYEVSSLLCRALQLQGL